MQSNLCRNFSLFALGGAALCWAPSANAQVLSDEAKALFDVSDFATGLSNPTDVAFLPDGRVLVTIKGGSDATNSGLPGGFVVYSKTGSKEKTFAGVFPQPKANHAGGEQGVLGLVVDPRFATNHLVYVFSAAGPSDADKMQIDAYALDGSAPDFKVSKQKTLVSMLIHGHRNHVGGGMDIYNGMLYIAVGEGGYVGYSRPGGADVLIDPTFANPTPKNHLAQCLNWGNGKILRINLDGSIPSDPADPNPLIDTPSATTCGDLTDNETKAAPFATGAPSKLVWAWGLRNPYRIWVDPLTGNVWAGDVGDASVEEIDIIEKGKNYGWPFFEGAQQRSLEANWGSNFPADSATKTCADVSPAGACAAPALTFAHGAALGDFTPLGTGSAIMGGLIATTANWPAAYRKKYFFADYAQSVVFTIDVNAGHSAIEPATAKAFMRGFAPTGFRMSPDGILYMVSHGGGSVFTVVPKGGPLVLPDPAGGAGGASGMGGDSSSAGDGTSAGDSTVGGIDGETRGAGAGAGPAAAIGGAPGSSEPDPQGAGTNSGGAPDSLAPTVKSGESAGCGCRVGPAAGSGVWALGLLLLVGRCRRRWYLPGSDSNCSTRKSQPEP